MSDIAIRVENLGKQYRLGAAKQNGRYQYKSLRDSLANAAATPLRALRLSSTKKHSHARRAGENFWALQGISFDVKQGEVVGIIGRNGAGKSTLLKILSRITEPTTGRAQIHGRVASLLEVGTGFHPELTGRENVYMNGAILGMTRAEIWRKFDEIVAFAEVEKFLDTPVKHYSSGMYVRLAFAVAAHLEQEILIIDEVLAVGDSEFQKKCLGKMQDVSRTGRTVLFVSHNMSAVQSLCGSGLLLEHGQLRRLGPVGSVLREYSAGIQRTSGLNGGGYTELGPALRLRRLDLGPVSIETGGPMSLRLQFVAEEPTIIKELAILIYSEHGVRVAILDLRGQGIRNLEAFEDALVLQVRIESLPLVEGDYRLGFYIATSDYQGDFLDVALFSVAAPDDGADVFRYAPQHRGFLEFDFSVHKIPDALRVSSSQ